MARGRQPVRSDPPRRLPRCDRVEHRPRRIEGFPEPTWEGVLRRRAQFPPWTDERLTIDSVNPRAENLQAALEYLSAS